MPEAVPLSTTATPPKRSTSSGPGGLGLTIDTDTHDTPPLTPTHNYPTAVLNGDDRLHLHAMNASSSMGASAVPPPHNNNTAVGNGRHTAHTHPTFNLPAHADGNNPSPPSPIAVDKPLPSLKAPSPLYLAPSPSASRSALGLGPLPNERQRTLPPTPTTPSPASADYQSAHDRPASAARANHVAPTPPGSFVRTESPSPLAEKDGTTPTSSSSYVPSSVRTMAEHKHFIPAAIVATLFIIYALGPRLFFTLVGLAAAPFIARYLLPPRGSPNPPLSLDEIAQGDAVGWVNHALRALFPLVSTDVLTPFVDLLEDALIQQVPPIVTSVRVSSVSLGTKPIVLTSLRPITDDEWFRSLDEKARIMTQSSVPYAKAKDITPANITKGRQPSETLSTRRRPSEIQRPYSLSPGSLAVPLSPGATPWSPTSASSFGSPSSVPAPIITPVSPTTPSRRATTRHTRSASNASRASFLTASDYAVSTHGSTQSGAPERAQTMRKRDRLLAKLRGNKGARRASFAPPTNGNGAPGISVIPSEPGEDDHDRNDEYVPFYDKDDPDGPQYVNYECGFVYQHTAAMGRGNGLHMITHFGVGVKGLTGTEWPVYLDVSQLSGKVRIRLLLCASPPFVREAAFSFVTMPQFDIAARPLGTFNAMDVPLVKSYVEKSIARVAGAFVAPKAFSMDVDRLLLGHESTLRTQSVGVFRIMIHGASGLPRTDTVGSSDPYLVVSYSKFNKPLFSTRTIVDTLDPVWEEPAYILVPAEAIEVGEKLRMRIIDSDRFSSDDSIGQVEVDVYDLVEKSTNTPGETLFRRTDALQPEQTGMRTQGELDWSIRFFPLYKMSQAEVQRRLQAIQDKRGEGYPPPPWWMEKISSYMEVPGWETERQERRKETLAYFTGERARDEMEAAGKPTAELCSGVLQFHVHQCTDLELESPNGTFSGSSISRRKSAASGKPALHDAIDRSAADQTDPPSSYVEIHVNDKYVYRTRTKQLNPVPYFNAVSERFIADWRLAKITFVVRDDRNREHDPIIGLVSLRLKDVLKDKCQFTRWFPLVGGRGWGRIRLSLLFKPFDMHLPQGISSFEAATLDILGLATTDMSELYGKQPSIVIETEHDSALLREPDDDDRSDEAVSARAQNGHGQAYEAHNGQQTASPNSARDSRHSAVSDHTTKSHIHASHTSGNGVSWDISKPVRLAVMYRHSCSVVFSLVQRRKIKKSKVHALATLRLDDCQDGVETTRKIPVYATASVRDAMRAARMFIDMGVQGGTANTPHGVLRGGDIPQVELVGFITVTFVLHSGMSRVHHILKKRDLKFRHVYEAWEAARLLEGSSHSNLNTDNESGSDSEDDSDSDNDDYDPLAREESRAKRRSGGAGAGAAANEAMQRDHTRELAERSGSHGKALRKSNKGIFQLKLARTGKFVKDKVEAKLLSSSVGTKVDARPRGMDLEVEHEGQSHF